MRATPAPDSAHLSLFLPNLCQAPALFVLTLGAGLLAVMLCVAKNGFAEFRFDDFAFLMLQTQWITLTSAFVLCGSNPKLTQYSPTTAGLLAFCICLITAAAVNILGQLLIDPLSTRGFNFFALLETLFITALISGVVLRYLYVQQQLRLQHEAELQARIQALQARIHPHFLFNSMNSIASLITIDPERAEELVVELAGLFRASLAEPTLIPLRQEIATCKQYLSLETTRLGERLAVEWNLDNSTLDLLVPNLSLQPLIENAIIHGIEPLAQGGVLVIQVQRHTKGLRIHLRNPYRAGPKPTPHGEAPKNNGIALRNIRYRLISIYGADARLTTSFDQYHFTTSIFIPIKISTKETS